MLPAAAAAVHTPRRRAVGRGGGNAAFLAARGFAWQRPGKPSVPPTPATPGVGAATLGTSPAAGGAAKAADAPSLPPTPPAGALLRAILPAAAAAAMRGRPTAGAGTPAAATAPTLTVHCSKELSGWSIPAGASTFEQVRITLNPAATTACALAAHHQDAVRLRQVGACETAFQLPNAGCEAPRQVAARSPVARKATPGQAASAALPSFTRSLPAPPLARPPAVPARPPPTARRRQLRRWAARRWPPHTYPSVVAGASTGLSAAADKLHAATHRCARGRSTRRHHAVLGWEVRGPAGRRGRRREAGVVFALGPMGVGRGAPGEEHRAEVHREATRVPEQVLGSFLWPPTDGHPRQTPAWARSLPAWLNSGPPLLLLGCPCLRWTTRRAATTAQRRVALDLRCFGSGLQCRVVLRPAVPLATRLLATTARLASPMRPLSSYPRVRISRLSRAFPARQLPAGLAGTCSGELHGLGRQQPQSAAVGGKERRPARSACTGGRRAAQVPVAPAPRHTSTHGHATRTHTANTPALGAVE